MIFGENMPKANFKKKEQWAFDTYGKGVLDAATEFPDRKITLIHRQHQAGAKDIARQFQPLVRKANTDLLFSFKYVFDSLTLGRYSGDSRIVIPKQKI